MNINVDPKPGKDAERAAMDEAMRLLQEKGINVNGATIQGEEGQQQQQQEEEVQEL